MTQIPTPPAHRISIKACPRCGRPKTVPVTGRPPTWCSQRCRRAAYEERRAAARGAIAVQLIDSGSGHHDIGECARRAQDSPAAYRRIIATLTSRAIGLELQYDLKWQSTLRAIARLADALAAPRRRR